MRRAAQCQILFYGAAGSMEVLHRLPEGRRSAEHRNCLTLNGSCVTSIKVEGQVPPHLSKQTDNRQLRQAPVRARVSDDVQGLRTAVQSKPMHET